MCNLSLPSLHKCCDNIPHLSVKLNESITKQKPSDGKTKFQLSIKNNNRKSVL